MITHCTTMGPLLAGTLGVAVTGLSPAAAHSAPPSGETQREIVVTATRPDAALAEAMTAALQQDPNIFSDHVSVTAEHGVVRVAGVVRSLPELFAIMRHARRIAGNGRIVDEIEYVPVDDEGN
jgi:osmotically-inducible protein OsmY